MRQTPSTGPNRTGIHTSHGCAAMQQDMELYVSNGDGADALRISYGQGEGLGSVPTPGGLLDVTKLNGGDSLLMDKLAERIAFERTGTRLYQALVSKHEAYGGFPGGPTRGELVQILAEEHRHFAMLAAAITELGGDPNALSPAADLAGVASSGILKVIRDPRTNLLHSLEAVLIAELTDNDAWQALTGLARAAGKDAMASAFQDALLAEEAHLMHIRAWLRAGRGLGEAPVLPT